MNRYAALPGGSSTDPLGVLMLNMGGPTTSVDVPVFLNRLFSDPAILPVPHHEGARRLLARLIVRNRAPRSARRYDAIGGGSPLPSIAVEQAAGLQRALHGRGVAATVLPALRYGPFFARDALDTLLATGVERVMALSLYPFYSSTTSGSSLREVRDLLGRRGDPANHGHRRTDGPASARRAPVTLAEVEAWHDNGGFIAYMAERVEAALADLMAESAGDRSVSSGGCAESEELRATSAVLFSAHSLPMKVVDAGDPYADQVCECANLIERRLSSRTRGDVRFALGYQSRTGPLRWLGPESAEQVRRLADAGVRRLLIVPLGFVAENIETLYDLDQVLVPYARARGILHVRRLPAPDADPAFLQVLADIVLEGAGRSAS